MKLNKKTTQAIKNWLLMSDVLEEMAVIYKDEPESKWLALSYYLLGCSSANVLETFAKDYNQIYLPSYLHQFFVRIPKRKKEDIAPIERTQRFINICYEPELGDL